MKTKILNLGKIIAFTSIAILSNKNSFGQCTTPTFQDDLNSSTGWTTVDPTNGNGSISIQTGEMHLHNPECNTTDGVHNNRQVRMYKPINQLDNFIWKAECRIRISNGNGASHTFMGFTAGNLCPQANPATNTWNCSTTSASVDNLITNWTNQDGIFASLIAFGYNNDSNNPNNQIPKTNNDQPFPPASVQNSNDSVPANLGWRIYGHAVDGLNDKFFGTGTARSSNYTGSIPSNRSRGIALPSIGNSFYVRLERLTANNCRISVFSDANMTSHVPGSPQCFEISPTIENLNTLQNFAHVSGSKFRRIRGEVDSYKIYNGCADVPNFNISVANVITCSNLTNTLIATSGATSYTWSNGTIPTTVTTSNSLTINPSVPTTYTVTASFNGSCPIKTTVTITPTAAGTLVPTINSPATICSSNNINVTGSHSGNVSVQNHYWEIIECTQAGVPVSTPSYSFANWYSGAPGDFSFPSSSTAPCNKYYRVVLAVQNLTSCVPWAATSQIVYVACKPTPVISGPTSVCFGSSATLCVNDTYSQPSSTYTLTWGPKKNNINCVTYTPSVGSNQYNVTVTNTITGCSGQATYIVNGLDNNPDFSLGGDLLAGSSTYTCRATPAPQTANLNPNFGYAWIVEEIDPITGSVVHNTTVTNPSCWWNYGLGTNIFSGYDGSNNFTCGSPNVGEFVANHKYRITRGTWITNSCTWKQISKTIQLCTSCKNSDGNSTFIVNNDDSAPDFSYLINKNTKNETENIVKLFIFPNPSNGLLNINLDNAIDSKYNIEVFDIYGKSIYKTEKLNMNGAEFKAEINLADLNLANGLYLINVSSNNQSSSQRIMIEK